MATVAGLTVPGASAATSAAPRNPGVPGKTAVTTQRAAQVEISATKWQGCRFKKPKVCIARTASGFKAYANNAGGGKTKGKLNVVFAGHGEAFRSGKNGVLNKNGGRITAPYKCPKGFKTAYALWTFTTKGKYGVTYYSNSIKC